jgi:SOS-response transcriptional repressor LexA
MFTKDIRRQNLRRLLKKFRFDREMADMAGLNPKHLSQMKTGKRDIGHDVARRIESAMKLPAGWMDTAPDGVSESVTKLLQNRGLLEQTVAVPIVTIQDLPKMQQILRDYDAGAELSTVSVTKATAAGLCGSAVAVTVPDASMTPEFSPGDVVIIDTGRQPEPGNFVVVQVGEDFLLRKFRPAGGGQIELRPSNPDYAPVTVAADGYALYGVVVEHTRRLLR